jgi:hypothetical protein
MTIRWINDMDNKMEKAWKWWCRILATAITVKLLLTDGLAAPWGLYVLLAGLFFGPEVLAEQVRINERVEKLRRHRKEEE